MSIQVRSCAIHRATSALPRGGEVIGCPFRCVVARFIAPGYGIVVTTIEFASSICLKCRMSQSLIQKHPVPKSQVPIPTFIAHQKNLCLKSRKSQTSNQKTCISTVARPKPFLKKYPVACLNSSANSLSKNYPVPTVPTVPNLSETAPPTKNLMSQMSQQLTNYFLWSVNDKM